MHTSPFISCEPVLFGVLESSEEYDSEDSLHFCGDERSSSPLIEFELLPAGLEYVVLDLNRESTSSFHDESLEMENQWAMEFCEAPTLESIGKDFIYDHGSFILVIPKNHALSTPLQSQARIVPRAHTRTITALRSSLAKPLEG